MVKIKRLIQWFKYFFKIHSSLIDKESTNLLHNLLEITGDIARRFDYDIQTDRKVVIFFDSFGVIKE